MLRDLSIRQIVTHPASIGTTVAAVLGTLANTPLLFDVGAWAVSHSGTIFTASSVLGFTVAPNLGGVPAWPFVGLAVGSGLVFAGWRIYRALGDLRERISR